MCLWKVVEHKDISKIKGDPIRHLEQLWDEINKLKERIRELEKRLKKNE